VARRCPRAPSPIVSMASIREMSQS